MAPTRQRPRGVSISSATTSRVLRAPLVLGPRWTSHDVAAATGVSQATVSRIWGQVFDRSHLGSMREVTGLGRGWGVAGIYSDPDFAALALTRPQVSATKAQARPDDFPGEGSWMRWPVRRSIQVLLATAESPPPRTLPETGEGASPAALTWWGEVCRAFRSTECVLLCADRGAEAQALLDSASSRAGLDGPTTIQVSQEQWSALLPWLCDALGPATSSEIGELEHRTKQWAADPQAALRLVASPRVRSIRPAAHITEGGQRITDSVAGAIHHGIVAGELESGDRVTEAWLIRRTLASRTYVRDALRELALDGLVELRPGRGALLPEPRAADVIETYELRQQLGTIILRSAAQWDPGDLRPARLALEQLEQTAQANDRWQAGQDDLTFQDAITQTVPLRRSPAMFRRMTQQIRFFIALHRLHYSYSADQMLVSDRAILTALQRRDADAAVEMWTEKVATSKAYLLQQL